MKLEICFLYTCPSLRSCCCADVPRSNSAASSAVYYDIVHGSHEQTNKFRTFVIDEDGNGGAVIKYGGSRPLDYEQVKEYNVTVRATVRAARVCYCVDVVHPVVPL